MKLLACLGALLVIGSSLVRAVLPGDTYASVLEEKGQPSGQVQAGAVCVLNYPDLCVKLRDKVVFEVKPVGAVKPVVASEGGSAPKPAPRKAERVLQQDAEAWMTDVPAALARARSEQRKVFLFFTGSDWCGWCKKLDGEILSTPEFRRYAESKLVLVKLDFPRSLPQSEELKTQNRALAKKYQIRGYPTVVVLDAEGRQVGQLGYQRGGPKPFIEALGGLQ